MSKAHEYIRLDLSPDEYTALVEVVSGKLEEEVMEKIKNPKHIPISVKKKKSASRMAQARWEETQKRVKEAIKSLEKNNEPVTTSALIKRAGVTYVTAKKYIDLHARGLL